MADSHSPVPRRFVTAVPAFRVLHLSGPTCFFGRGFGRVLAALLVCGGGGAVQTVDLTDVAVDLLDLDVDLTGFVRDAVLSDVFGGMARIGVLGMRCFNCLIIWSDPGR